MPGRPRPIIVFEHGLGGAERCGTTAVDVDRLLRKVGLRIFDIDGEGPYDQAKIAAIFTRPLWNFVAHV